MLGNIRRVHAQQPDRVGRPAGELDDNRVSVDHLDDARSRRGVVALVTEPPPRDRGGHQDRGDEGSGACHVGLDTAERS